MTSQRRVVLCNGASGPRGALRLDYRPGESRNVTVSLPRFVQTLLYLPDRMLDLLELASYVFAADRLARRGRKNAVEYHSWARSFRFVVRVRDLSFWSRASVRLCLAELLQFMSGDKEYTFQFQGGHSTPPTTLFDSGSFLVDAPVPTNIALFSGGLDSLTGVLQLLRDTPASVCLVSHESQTGTVRTQQKLLAALRARFGGRVHRFGFHCTLHDERANEESQRTRMFLYGSIAAALAHSFSRNEFYVFENGVTAINIPRRQDLMNARATRTTHPMALTLLQKLLCEVLETEFEIKTPFQWNTKADVLARLDDLGGRDLISSSVSCSRTFQNVDDGTHCGACSQCIERRLAAYAVRLEDADEAGIYSTDFIAGNIRDGETRTMLVDYIRLANQLAGIHVDRFAHEHINELADLMRAFGNESPHQITEQVWALLRRHGEQVMTAVRRMRDVNDSPGAPIPRGSLLRIIAQRDYLKDPVRLFVEDVWARLSVGIPLAFKTVPPRDENDFNDKVAALLHTEKERLEREHPAVTFALAKAVPDHSSSRHSAFIESKYLRKSTTPSKATEDLAADLTKYGQAVYIIFVIYDPHRSISDDAAFKADFEALGHCAVLIIR